MSTSPVTQPARFVVLTASAHMPNKVKHPYRRVAVVELTEPGVLPKMISPRARGVRRLVQVWERCHVGSGSANTAYGRALEEANWLAARLNAAQ